MRPALAFTIGVALALIPPASLVQSGAVADAAWMGCYRIHFEQVAGSVEPWGVVELDTLASEKLRSAYTARMVPPPPRASVERWTTSRGDSLVVVSTVHGVTTIFFLSSVRGDSLAGRFEQSGPRVPPRRAYAKRIKSGCFARLNAAQPLMAIRGNGEDRYDLELGDSVLPVDGPQWLRADSMLSKAPDGRRFVRNTILVTLMVDHTLERDAIIRQTGGVVVGRHAPPERPSLPRRLRPLIIYLPDSPDLRDIQRLAESMKRVSGVFDAGAYYPR
jgi:hypothetical protein